LIKLISLIISLTHCNQTNVRGLTSARMIMQRQPTALREEYDWNPGTTHPSTSIDSTWAQTCKLMSLARDPNRQLWMVWKAYISLSRRIKCGNGTPHGSPSASEVDSSWLKFLLHEHPDKYQDTILLWSSSNPPFTNPRSEHESCNGIDFSKLRWGTITKSTSACNR